VTAIATGSNGGKSGRLKGLFLVIEGRGDRGNEAYA
jgi:hypothetical protein